MSQNEPLFAKRGIVWIYVQDVLFRVSVVSKVKYRSAGCACLEKEVV